MSRLGGGIGTRGPGETKLESDRRHIRRRIKNLEDGLEALSRRRKLARERREKDEVETVAIVGYTNAGKSTLMNALTQAGVLAEDKLFATLDPTSRALTLPDGRRVMLIGVQIDPRRSGERNADTQRLRRFVAGLRRAS